MSDLKVNQQLGFGGLAENVLAGQSILDVFVLQNVIGLEDAERLKQHFRTNREVEDFLIKKRLVSRETINKAYSILLKLPFISLANVEISPEVLEIIPKKLADRYSIIAFSVSDRTVRLAIAHPSDILLKYPAGLADLIRRKDYDVELFITSDRDLSGALKQYDRRKGDSVLIKKGSLPVVYLRNQHIPERFLKKLPHDFIQKYRLVVFNQNHSNEYMIACELPDSVVTRKVVEYINKENNIKTELFATSKEDIDYVLGQYGRQADKVPETVKKEVSLPQEASISSQGDKSKSSIGNLLDALLNQSPQQDFTIDNQPNYRAFVDAGEVKSDSKAESTGAVIQPPEESKSIETKEELAKLRPVSDKKGTTKIYAPAKEHPTEIRDKEAARAAIAKTSSAKNLEEKDIGVLLGGEEIRGTDSLQRIIKESYVPKIVAAIIDYALHSRASDIHLEPGTKHFRIRCRVDGILRDVAKMPVELHPPVLSRIKILSRLKIDENRVPQDGRFDLVFKGRSVDVRVSTLPTVNGEKAVLRVLDKEQATLSLEDLGMQGSAFKLTVDAVARPYGIILSTGPTGSGKSTTLYAILSRVSVPGINIVTLEDPVEYEIPGISQCQVKPEIGFTFATGLRSVLRQDPNVIMVGEIRDAETAGMATHAALTGHLVLSTLHTNDTAGALPRLINMGVEPFLITSSINLIIAQRLVRRICPKCKEEMKVPPKLVEEIGVELGNISPQNKLDLERIPKEPKFYYGRGCNECNQGFKGRIGIFEVMEIDPEIEDLAAGKRPANEIKEAALKNGMITMKQDGIIKVLNGLTTIDEIFQATLV